MPRDFVDCDCYNLDKSLLNENVRFHRKIDRRRSFSHSHCTTFVAAGSPCAEISATDGIVHWNISKPVLGPVLVL